MDPAPQHWMRRRTMKKKLVNRSRRELGNRVGCVPVVSLFPVDELDIHPRHGRSHLQNSTTIDLHLARWRKIATRTLEVEELQLYGMD